MAKKMKVAVKGGAAVDPESGSSQHLNSSPSSSYSAGLFKKLKTCTVLYFYQVIET